MKRLYLTLKLSDLGETTHIWFPASAGEFNPAPTAIQTDKKYGNRIAYFYFRKDSPWRTPRRIFNRIKIQAVFPVSEIATSFRPRVGTQFFFPNGFVQSDDDIIKRLASTLTKKFQTDEEKARRCFDFVVGYLTYANPIRGLYSSIQALTDRGVDCGGFSTLLVALLRAAKIPAHCVFGWAINSKFGYHAWAQYFDRQKNSWVPMDPSAAHLGKRTKLDAGFGFINNDRIALSVGEDIELAGQGIGWITPLLQSPVVVSVDESGLPKPILEDLNWFVV